VRVLTGFAAVLSVAASALAAELVLQPGAEGKDAMVNILEPTVNFGNYSYLMVNFGPATEVRGLVEFEGLSAISRATRGHRNLAEPAGPRRDAVRQDPRLGGRRRPLYLER